MTEEKKVEVESEVKEYSLINVPTQHTLAIQTPEGELLSVEQAMVVVLNKLTEIRKFY